MHLISPTLTLCSASRENAFRLPWLSRALVCLLISRGIRSSRPIHISGSLKSEIQHWTFLESWGGFLPWRKEFHHQIILCADASSFAWGGVFSPDAQPIIIHDYWPSSQRHLDINAKEILALSNFLLSFSQNISNCWVDVFTDSQVLIKSWQNQRGKSYWLISALKQLFSVIIASNIHLCLHYIRSDVNPADAPSRTLSLQDSKLSPKTWAQLQERFGGSSCHSVDLMALPSNVQSYPSGSPLPFFSPFPVPGAAGVNLFAQLPHRPPLLFRNPHVFPPNYSYPGSSAFHHMSRFFMHFCCSGPSAPKVLVVSSQTLRGLSFST